MSTIGQELYLPISSKGIIPPEFTLKPYENFLVDKQKYSEFENSNEKETAEKFYLESNYMLDHYYRSGAVLFNSQLNTYINKIVDYLLKDNKKLRSELHFYILKSDDFNAFSTGKGIIFINIGLIAKVQSEAQLAFVIAHEIAHYTKNHTLNAYIEKKESQNGEKSYKNLNYDYKLVKLSNYSKAQELMADKEGLNKFYLNTQYSLKEVRELFNTMLYSYLPIGKTDSIITYLEKTSLIIPEVYKLKDTNPIIAIENYNDSLSSHPNIKLRKENIDSIISSISDEEKSDFVISKVEFDNIQKTARYELTCLYLQTLSYEDVICNSYSILQDTPDDKYGEFTIGFALLQIANYKAKDDFYNIHKSSAKIQGSSQKLFFFTEKMTDLELGILALCYNWNLKHKYPSSNFVKNLVDLSFQNLTINLKLGLKDFNPVNNPDSKYYKNESLAYFEEKEFVDKFLFYEDMLKKKELEKEELISNAEKRKAIANENKLIQEKGFALGIDKIVVVNPLSLYANYRQTDIIQWEQSEILRYELASNILNISDKINLDVELLDLKYFKEDEIEKYNDYCLLSNWFIEKCSHLSDEYPTFNSIYIDSLVKKYGTKYFAWTGLYTEKNSKFINSKNAILDFYLFNIETGKILLSQREYVASVNERINQVFGIKKILNQIKNKRN